LCDSHFDTELAILHQPMSRIPKIKNELTILIENYIHQMGIDAIHLVSGPAINVNLIFINSISILISIILGSQSLY
jgi:hypothetical protein